MILGHVLFKCLLIHCARVDVVAVDVVVAVAAETQQRVEELNAKVERLQQEGDEVKAREQAVRTCSYCTGGGFSCSGKCVP